MTMATLIFHDLAEELVHGLPEAGQYNGSQSRSDGEVMSAGLE